jgi:23S rRNA (uracil1939-C5)-methyltransferase
VARPRAPRIDKTPFEAEIVDHSHDGRGVARRDGKTLFVAGALPGERVLAEQTAKNRHFDEARTMEVLQASPDRVIPRCEHFGTCSGCVLQHLAEDKQILLKQRVLLENLERIGHVAGPVLVAQLFLIWGQSPQILTGIGIATVVLGFLFLVRRPTRPIRALGPEAAR